MEQGNILEARNITKVYPGGVVANHNVNLSVKKGEIHALVGENGAGKSTLMKMLFGMLAPTEGQIFVDGKEVHFPSSGDAIAAGLGMVHQHFMQVPSMTVAENLILGAENGSPFKVDRKKAVEITRELSERYNLKVEAEEKVEDISLAMRQKLEILKALYRGAHILILDEPTAVLTPQETEELFEQLLLLKESGHTIIFISHKLNEVKALCNRMTILRDGKTMGTYEISDLDEHEISRLMVGREVSLDIEKAEADFGKTVFSVKFNNKNDLRRLTDLPIAGEICHSSTSGYVVLRENSVSPAAEMFRLLRSNLQFMLPGGGKGILLVTSSEPGEGKSFVSLNLAYSIALMRKRTVLIDLDLRNPKIADYLGLSVTTGLTNYLVSNKEGGENDLIHHVAQEGFLDVITAGRILPSFYCPKNWIV